MLNTKEPLSSDAVLGESWRDVVKDLPANSDMVLGAWFESCGDFMFWAYAVVKYNAHNQEEWMKDDREVVKVEFWQGINPPADVIKRRESSR